jgi:hypothetical protein
MKKYFIKLADRAVARVLPEVTAAGCCPPDYHTVCVNYGPCSGSTGWTELEAHYTCNCQEVFTFQGWCCPPPH